MAGPRRGDARGPCPIGRAIDVLGDRWTLLVLRNATIGMSRFDEFKADLGIADNILSDRLRKLVEHGLLTKRPYRDESGGRTRNEYRLTEAGAAILPVLHAMYDWGATHTGPAESTAPMQVVHRTCGEPVEPGGDCPRCGVHVTREEEAWVRPWRSPEAIPLAPAV
ncbi:winged helix-turn-helix transcriptional regulator [Pseudonocardia alaniniphila]|uniref:Helix-turn-helix transcriptional regulator n=1 Tax=Pseudonocardia alaniniphila TaxID=75291 RepID=A0ABS9TKZ0_9PSEU|nr:helix-turn-helix domain-containing protein [Pseudonocardia alaniniphila]MCH6169204.1 helix-turn-helix transcriptional regulator [Pseudonocardia alaniniphila]